MMNEHLEMVEHRVTPPSAESDEFTLRLKTLVAAEGSVSALAKKAGISHSGLLRYLAGGDPSRKVLVALSQAANVDLTWLATGLGERHQGLPKQSLTLLPLYDSASTSHGDLRSAAPTGKSTLTELAFCRAWLNRNGLDYTHLKALTMQGDSMAPSIAPGDTLLIDITRTGVVCGKIYVIEDSGNLLLRRIQLEVGNRLRLVSDNPAYRAFDLAAPELSVIGQVVWSARLS